MALTLKMTGGAAGGGAPTAVGAFQAISERTQKLRQLQEELAANNDAGILSQATAAGTLMLRDVTAYQFSPVLTGTLRAAHRAEVYSTRSRAQGIVYIDPAVQNPVYEGRPAVYGMELIEMGRNWPAEAVAAAGQMVLDIMYSHIESGITRILHI